MRLVTPTLLDLMQLCARARPDEIEQYEALVGRPWVLDDVVAGHHSRVGIKFALIDDHDTPVCAAGWDPVVPGVWNGWMVGTMANWERHWAPITLHCNRIMRHLLRDGARRLEIGVLAGREKTCEWYERGLKMRQEGVKRQYGAQGQDMLIYTRLREPDHGLV